MTQKPKQPNRIWWMLSLVVLIFIVIYLNRAYAYFFDYLGSHEILPPSDTVAGFPRFVLNHRENPPGKSAFYYALGDSLTRGVGVQDNLDTYPYKLGYLFSKHNDIFFENLAIPGSTTADLVDRQLPKVLNTTSQRVGYISVLVGINDVLNSVGSSKFRQNYERILDDLIKVKTDKLVVINIPYLVNPQVMLFPYNLLVDWRVKQFNSIIEDLVQQKRAEGANIEYVDLYSQTKKPFSEDQNLYSNDRFHPNAKGYALWSRIINEQTLF